MRKKLFSMLVLLMTAVTGAWAEEETLLTTITPTGDGTYSETTAGAVTVTPAGSFFYSGSSYGWRWDSYGSLTVTANEGYTITRCVFIQQGKNQSVTISEAPFALNFEEWLCLENTSMDGVTSIEVYGTAPAAPAASTYTVQFEANGNSITREVTLPHEFKTSYSNENGELDGIIKELYGLSLGYCSKTETPTASGNSNVTASLEGNDQCITIAAAFEGTAQVTGKYFSYEGAWENQQDIYYTLTISVTAPAAAATENETIIFNNLGLADQYNLTSGPLNVGNIELNFAQNGGLNPPKFYTDGSAARIYSGNSMSISAGGATITKIVFNLTQGTPTFNTGSYNTTTSTWEGEATTLTLNNEAFGHIRIVSMDVYYSVASAAGEAGYSVTLKEGTEDASNWQGKAGEGEYQSLPLEGVAAGTAVSLKYGGALKVKSVKAKKKSSAPTLKDALADGATVVINYTWMNENVTTFTYTNNGGNYTGSTTGDDAEYFANGMSVDGTTLRFTASNPDISEANVSIDFDTDTNEYAVSKGSGFTSFTISVNGTDLTSQLTKVK